MGAYFILLEDFKKDLIGKEDARTRGKSPVGISAQSLEVRGEAPGLAGRIGVRGRGYFRGIRLQDMGRGLSPQNDKGRNLPHPTPVCPLFSDTILCKHCRPIYSLPFSPDPLLHQQKPGGLETLLRRNTQ